MQTESKKFSEKPSNPSKPSPRRGVKFGLCLLSDLVLTGICLCIFSLFHHVLPKTFRVETLTDGNNAALIDIPTYESVFNSGAISGEVTTLEQLVEQGKRYEDSPLGERTKTHLDTYTSDNVRIVLNEVSYGEGDETVTYYVADLFVTSVKYLQTSVATTKGGSVTTEMVYDQAESVDALFAVSGDYFKNSEIGLVVRNGKLYRNETTPNDVCLLYLDGTMEILPGDELSVNELKEKGVWQSWVFGPSLLTEDGQVKTSNSQFNVNASGTYHNVNEDSTNGIYSKHPRNLIGYVEPGHYVLILVDGRNLGHSCGVTFLEASQIAYDEGCTLAYNLDGGRSAMMYYQGQIVDKPYKGGREISDIIYIGESSVEGGNGLTDFASGMTFGTSEGITREDDTAE